MELRSRKKLSEAPADDIVLEQSCDSDEELYVPSFESDHTNLSEGESDVDQEDVAGANMDNISVNIQENPRKRKSKRTTTCKKKRREHLLLWEVWEEENERFVDEHLTEDIDLDQQNALMMETSAVPAELVMPLLRYQKEWLAWALKQEDSAIAGGILADEMGMGKTIQAIALIIAKRNMYRDLPEFVTGSCSSGVSVDMPFIKGTLVICPLVAVTQWVSEIDRFTLSGSVKVLIYHGANRGRTAQQLMDYDVVVTTYSTVEAEYRRYMMPPKQRCIYCGKLLYPKKLSIHLKYFCGPSAVRTEKQSKQERKKGKNLGKKASDHEHLGSVSKAKGAGKKALKVDNEVVEHEASVMKGKSILHSVRWTRIILDEAHYIKDRHSNTARAVFSLESQYRWALSGTPLQNRVGELYSLVRFLQIVPYSYYLCKDCDCRVLDQSSSTGSNCANCPHKRLRHFCWWNKYVAKPIQMHGGSDTGIRAMILLKHKVLSKIILRRTKKGRAADLALPPRILKLRRDALDIKEADYYESLYNESQSQFNTYVHAGTLLNNYAHIFDLLTRLRQAVDHPYLVVYSNSATTTRNESLTDAGNNEQMCGICHDLAEDAVVTSCSHVFCKACLIDFSASLGKVSCPSCSKLLTVDLTRNACSRDQITKRTIKGFKSSSIINRIRLDDFQTSTKIEALREEIRLMIERDGCAKGIVFSQFTSFLDLISFSLQKSGVNCVQLVGSMSLAGRDAAIKRFIEDPDCTIFLMSLKAGGVALNLTVASHVFVMDPWWNPAVERQAQDRIHRIGQHKPIRIVRFVIENTIEERILELQKKKELVFEGTVGGSAEAMGKLSVEDMRFLFT